MLTITHAEASRNILAAVKEKRLVQGIWHKRDEGREIACLLGSIHSSVTSAAQCNGALMPMWLAELTPVLFDGIPEKSTYPIALRYGKLVAVWHKISAEQWDRILTRVLIRCIDVAVSAAKPVAEREDYWPAVASACDQVKEALVSGDAERLSVAESAARRAAWRALERAVWSAANAAANAANAANAAANGAESAESAARSAAANAARSAANAAANAAAIAANAARSAAYLSLFNFVLDQIEAEMVDG